MNYRHLVKGLLLATIALAFGMGAMRYPVGDFANAGPGLFPLLVSALLLLIAATIVVRSWFMAPEPLQLRLRNVALILLGMCGFALLSKFVNAIVGIVFMVFVTSFANAFSWRRNLKIAAALIAVAFAFQKFLGLNLPLL